MQKGKKRQKKKGKEFEKERNKGEGGEEEKREGNEKKKKTKSKKGSANVRQMVHRRCCLREETGEGERSACVMEGKEGR